LDLPDPEQAFWLYAGCRLIDVIASSLKEDGKHRIRARYNKNTVRGSTSVVVSTSS